MKDPVAHTVEAELARPAWEEREAIAPQDAASMRWHAHGLRGAANAAEDKGSQMVKVSVRWARVIAAALEEGALAADIDHG